MCICVCVLMCTDLCVSGCMPNTSIHICVRHEHICLSVCVCVCVFLSLSPSVCFPRIERHWHVKGLKDLDENFVHMCVCVFSLCACVCVCVCVCLYGHVFLSQCVFV